MRLFKIDDRGELDPLSKLIFNENDVYLVDDKEKNTIYIWVGSDVIQKKKDITAEIARKLDKDRGGSTKILIMKQKREYGSFLAMMHNLEKGLIPGETIERRPEFVFEAPPETIESVKLDGTPEKREETVESRIVQWLMQLKEHRIDVPKETTETKTESVKFIRFEKETPEVEPSDTSHFEQPTFTKDVSVEDREEIDVAPEEPELKTYVREAAYYLSLKKYTYDELCWLLSEKIQKISLRLPSIEDIKNKAEEVFRSGCTYDELCWLNAEMDFLIEKSFLGKDSNNFHY
ncbi:MAG: hypothetical protein ACW98X_10105 [Promethearchaeota archaeon]|jgi:hypothetical protein